MRKNIISGALEGMNATAYVGGVTALGIGLANAILLDATVTRLFLIPSLIALLGRWNWYLPAFLDP